MKKEFEKILKIVSQTLTSAGYDFQAREEAGKEISQTEREFYNTLDFVYDLLTRTELSKSIVVKTPEEMKEPGFEDEYSRVYGITADDIADFSFALVNKTGVVSLRNVLRTMIHRSGFGEHATTMKEVCSETNQGYPNMSRYLNNQQTLYADNVEKALNFIIRKKSY